MRHWNMWVMWAVVCGCSFVSTVLAATAVNVAEASYTRHSVGVAALTCLAVEAIVTTFAIFVSANRDWL